MIKQIVQLLHCFWCGDKLQTAALKAQATTKTACKWYSICRLFCEWSVKSDRSCIGGFGKTVEIDEAVFGQRKYHRGRKKRSIIVVGGIQRQSRIRLKASCSQSRIFLELVSDRSSRTLEAVVVKHVNPRTTIITDCFAGYNALVSHGYRHKTVNHSKNFIDPGTGANTQRIENLWSHLREFLPKRGLRPNKLQSYLYEFVYKRNHSGQFKQFLAEIVTTCLEELSDEENCIDPDYSDDDGDAAVTYDMPE